MLFFQDLVNFYDGVDIFEIVILLVEFVPYILAINVVMLFTVKPSLRVPTLFAFPFSLAVMTLWTVVGSYTAAQREGFDVSIMDLFSGKSVGVRSAVEDYVTTGKGDITDILEGGKYAPLFEKHAVKYLLKDLFSHSLLHTNAHNADNIAVGYNKGHDWFEATLNTPMVYTSGIYKTGTETLEEAQNYKLDYVAHALDLKKGDKLLDIGCGWGRLLKHMTEKYGAKCTGVTLSKDQKAYGEKLNGDNGAKIVLHDFMTVPFEDKSFDKISTLEMAEHVGIKRYNAFLRKIHRLLKDDGSLYFQVAGLRRQWHYEDLVWGLFMGEHVFPGADASCPIGWVSTQIERGGFEVQRVHNLGSHYSKTLAQWLETWRSKEAEMTKAYGAEAYRRWEVFLAWSVRVARQGSSTVFMVTATKHGQEAARIEKQQHLAPQLPKSHSDGSAKLEFAVGIDKSGKKSEL
jgi:cyclopropane fatty-acyl-phospholipid synthase-like methyltransferase